MTASSPENNMDSSGFGLMSFLKIKSVGYMSVGECVNLEWSNLFLKKRGILIAPSTRFDWAKSKGGNGELCTPVILWISWVRIVLRISDFYFWHGYFARVLTFSQGGPSETIRIAGEFFR
jgi:hypothetical protein